MGLILALVIFFSLLIVFFSIQTIVYSNKPDFKSREASQNKWKERFQELEVEYENHRRRTLEREQRISRMLQDEIRKGKNAG
tara:strand:- start:512 stop:757 length:246 start_codon:yes stop_codon:yes gene_type:complete